MEMHIFVCPLCKGPLHAVNGGYSCASCMKDYPIIDSIPDFFIPEPGEDDNEVWQHNMVWQDPAMVEARETIYRLSVRQLKGMIFAMQQLGLHTFPGCRILEVGMGTGHFTQWMGEVSAPGTEIYAIDYSWPMFAKARLNIGDQPGVVLLRANSIGPLPFPEACFDLIFLRLAPLGRDGISNIQAAFQLLKPGGWLFKAGWNVRPEDVSWTEQAIQTGYTCAEMHEWLYPRTKTAEEYAASLVENERAIAFGAPFGKMPAEPESLVMMTWENLRIAQKPMRE